MINYRILLKSLRIFIKKYKGTLKNGRSNGNMQSKVYKIFKSNKDFSITANIKINILE